MIEGYSALMEAAKKGNTENVKSLIEAKADINEVNKFGWTALMLAAEHGLFRTC